MKIKRIIELTMVTILSTSLFGCGDVVVKVNKKGKAGSSDVAAVPSGSTEKNSSEVTIDDVADYLQDVDKLKKDGAQFIIEKLKAGWRGEIRKSLRQLRSSIIRNAATEHSYKNELFKKINEIDCSDINKLDISILDKDTNLGTLLQGSLLAALDKASAAELHPKLPGQIDEITKMIMFEMGVNVKGQSRVSKDGNRTIMESDIIWQVIHETNEDAALEEEDAFGISLGFRRIIEEGKPETFELEVRVAKGLYQGEIAGDVYYMVLNLVKDKTSVGGLKIETSIENGIKNGEGAVTSKVYARKMVFSQEGANKDIFVLQDIARLGMEGEETREARIDFGMLKACKVDKTGKGDVKDTPKDKPKDEVKDTPKETPKETTTEAPKTTSPKETTPGDYDKGTTTTWDPSQNASQNASQNDTPVKK